MDLFSRFNDFIAGHDLLPPGAPVLVALSGGIDSVVLAHLFRRSGRPFGVAHCNFQLRGAESDEDAVFVRTLATSWEAPVWVERFETGAYARENGVSIQVAARELRYAWFEELRREHGFAAVAVGHTLNDSVETALFNFVRGTGLAGLTGIAPRHKAVVRPLLFATRAEVEAYALDLGLHWREDSSNQSDAYARNFLRHQVIPHLESLNPDFFHTAGRNLRRLRSVRENYAFLLEQFVGLQPSDGALPIEYPKARLAALPARGEALLELLRPHGFTVEQCRQLDAGWSSTGLELESASGLRLVNDRDRLRLLAADASGDPAPPPRIPVEADDLLVTLPDGSRLALLPVPAESPFPDGRETVLVDAGKLKFPLLLRPWQPGDKFQPLGMAGQAQKLQDFFTDRKLSRPDKEATWLLTNADGAVIWVVGWRPDERFKITPATRQALKVHWIRK
jgi:tRNA(Ile)-lysidine synthase